MLVLTRMENELVQIGRSIRVRVLSIRKGRVALGFDAPANVNIVRTELLKGLCQGCYQKPCICGPDDAGTWEAA